LRGARRRRGNLILGMRDCFVVATPRNDGTQTWIPAFAGMTKDRHRKSIFCFALDFSAGGVLLDNKNKKVGFIIKFKNKKYGK